MSTQQWVSVKFDKPKFDEENPIIRSIRCLVFDGKSIGVACFARDAFSSSQPGRWEDEFGGKCRTEITHWMTLPDLPVIENTTTVLKGTDESFPLGMVSKLMTDKANLLEALNEINNWLVCSAIATPEDMAQSFGYMQGIAENAINEAAKAN